VDLLAPFVGMCVGAASAILITTIYVWSGNSEAFRAGTIATVSFIVLVPFLTRWPITLRRGATTAGIWLISWTARSLVGRLPVGAARRLRHWAAI